MASDIRAKGMMLFDDRCGRYYHILNDEQLGFVVRLAHRVWAGEITIEEAVQEASDRGEDKVTLAVWDFADGALRGAKSYKKMVQRGGIGGMKRSFLALNGWDEKRFEDKVKEMRDDGLEEQTIVETLKAIYQSEKKKEKAIDIVNSKYSSPRQGQPSRLNDIQLDSNGRMITR